jgi:hypothetical protein
MLIAVMPANIEGTILLSHGGLTFGGIVSDERMKASVMLEAFNALKSYLKSQGITKIIYKAIPHIYHSVPAEEDLYVLFLHNAKLIRRDVSSTIIMKKRIALAKGRKWCVGKGKRDALDIKKDDDFKTFMIFEEENLKKNYGVKPAHTADEMQLLANRFPENIKLFIVHKDSTMIAGVIIYESKNVAHVQYMAVSEKGKKAGALDSILDFLINGNYKEKRYFDFGISTEKNGLYLNEGLIFFKESFGARAVVYDFYEVDIK